MKKKQGLNWTVFVLFWVTLILSIPLTSLAREPYEITMMTTPFGTTSYTIGQAFEETFKKENSWVQWKTQETPGAMYIIRYLNENRDKMINGEIPFVISSSAVAVLPFTAYGWKPFEKYPIPHTKAFLAQPAFIFFFGTFDPNIKSLKDLEGKKVGIAEKSRPFTSILPLKPYFEKGLGIWDKVDWQYLGWVNSKDALLNNKIDAMYCEFQASLEQRPDGSLFTRLAAASPAVLELMNSGRQFYLVPFDPKTIKESFDFTKNMWMVPALMEKGAVGGVNRDLWGLTSPGLLRTDEEVPTEVIQEIYRVYLKRRHELGKYHNALKLLPENPYPVGTPEEFVHPGVEKALSNLGLTKP